MMKYAQAMNTVAEPGKAVKRAWWSHFVYLEKGRLMMEYCGRLVQYVASDGDLDAADWVETHPSIGIPGGTRRAS